MTKSKPRRSKAARGNAKQPDPKVEMAAQLFAELFWRQVRSGRDKRKAGKSDP
jgi:hypothetical protein